MMVSWGLVSRFIVQAGLDSLGFSGGKREAGSINKVASGGKEDTKTAFGPY